jgi:hypothetical protein
MNSKTKKRITKIREVAQRFADIEFGDHGTLGGNVAPD